MQVRQTATITGTLTYRRSSKMGIMLPRHALTTVAVVMNRRAAGALRRVQKVTGAAVGVLRRVPIGAADGTVTINHRDGAVDGVVRINHLVGAAGGAIKINHRVGDKQLQLRRALLVQRCDVWLTNLSRTPRQVLLDSQIQAFVTRRQVVYWTAE
jgi:hypothetical protein